MPEPWRRRWAMSQASLMGFRRLRGGAAQGLVRPPRGRRPPRQDPGRKRILGQPGYRKMTAY